MTTPFDFDAYEDRNAITNTIKWMEEQIETFKKTAAELERYKERFIENAKSEDPSCSSADHLSWFVNATKFADANLRLDLAVRHAIALQKRDDRLKEAARKKREEEKASRPFPEADYVAVGPDGFVVYFLGGSNLKEAKEELRAKKRRSDTIETVRARRPDDKTR